MNSNVRASMAIVAAILLCVMVTKVWGGEVGDMARRLAAVRPLDPTLRCQACKSIVESLVWDVQFGLGKDHPDTIDLGSSSMKGKNKKKKAFKYYGSETMVTELLNRVCEIMGQHNYQFKLSTQNISLPPEVDEAFGGQQAVKKSFKSYCYSFVEEYEDDIKEKIESESALLRLHSATAKDEFVDQLCRKKANVCTSGDFRIVTKDGNGDEILPNRDDL